MLSVNNHLKVIDFGTAYFFKSVNNNLLEIINKIRNSEKTEQDPFLDYQTKHKATFVGTAEYSFIIIKIIIFKHKLDMFHLNCLKMVNVKLLQIYGH